MSLLSRARLKANERRIYEAAALGRLLDLRTQRDEEDDPAQGQHWGVDRQIPAELLRRLLTGEGRLQDARPPTAVRIRGALVVGPLDLANLTLPCPLELEGSYLSGRVDLSRSRGPNVSFAGSYLEGSLNAYRLRLDHDFNMSYCLCRGGVTLLGSQIGGHLDCSGAHLRNDAGPALAADRLTVDGSVMLSDGFSATCHSEFGAVRLHGSHVRGQVNCSHSDLANNEGPALIGHGLTVNDGLILAGLTAAGHSRDATVALVGAHIGGMLDCSGADLTDDSGPALRGDGLTVDGGVFLGDGFTATGQSEQGTIRLVGAHIGGFLSCSGARISSDIGPALVADRLSLDGDLLLSDGFTATGHTRAGTIRLHGAVIRGQVNCSGADLANDTGPALIGDGLTVNDGMFLTGFTAIGHGSDATVRLLGAHIGGALDCPGAHLINGTGPALGGERLTVDGGLFLRDDFIAVGHSEFGAIRLFGAHISGQLACRDSQLTNHSGPALSAEGLTIDGSFLLRDGVAATGHGKVGAIRLSRAHITGQLACRATYVTNHSGPALSAQGITVDGDVLFRDDFTATGHSEDGTIFLAGARIGGRFQCSAARLTNGAGPVLALTNAVLGSLRLAPDMGTGTAWSLELSDASYRGIPTGATLDEWLKLLKEHSPQYAPQPWQQLAAAHRAAGHEGDARRILIAQQDDRRRRLLRPAPGARWRTRSQRWAYRTYLGMLRLVVGYGYQTWRALIALLVIVLAAAGLGLLAGHTHVDQDRYVAQRTRATDSATQTNQGEPCSTVEQIGLGLDVALPLIKTNIRTRCDLNSTTATGQWITVASWVLQALSWGAATLVIAGYTGVVRRN